MIIWGSYVIRKELKSGKFFCPSCEDDRQYVHKLPRRWGHLYWIPLIIMDTLDSYVECQTCSNAYKEEVIDYDPRLERSRKLASLAAMIGQIMIHAAHAGGRPITLPEIERDVKELLNIDRLPPEAETQITTPTDRNRMLTLVRENGDNLVPRGKEIVLRTAIGPGPLDPQAQALIVDIGIAMGMTATHAKAVLAEALPSGERAAWSGSQSAAG